MRGGRGVGRGGVDSAACIGVVGWTVPPPPVQHGGRAVARGLATRSSSRPRSPSPGRGRGMMYIGRGAPRPPSVERKAKQPLPPAAQPVVKRRRVEPVLPRQPSSGSDHSVDSGAARCQQRHADPEPVAPAQPAADDADIERLLDRPPLADGPLPLLANNRSFDSWARRVDAEAHQRWLAAGHGAAEPAEAGVTPLTQQALSKLPSGRVYGGRGEGTDSDASSVGDTSRSSGKKRQRVVVLRHTQDNLSKPPAVSPSPSWQPGQALPTWTRSFATPLFPRRKWVPPCVAFRRSKAAPEGPRDDVVEVGQTGVTTARESADAGVLAQLTETRLSAYQLTEGVKQGTCEHLVVVNLYGAPSFFRVLAEVEKTRKYIPEGTGLVVVSSVTHEDIRSTIHTGRALMTQLHSKGLLHVTSPYDQQNKSAQHNRTKIAVIEFNGSIAAGVGITVVGCPFQTMSELVHQMAMQSRSVLVLEWPPILLHARPDGAAGEEWLEAARDFFARLHSRAASKSQRMYATRDVRSMA